MTRPIIDTDLHNAAADPAAIGRRLPRHYRQPGYGMPGMMGYGNPTGSVNRHDSKTISGGPPGSCIQTIREHLLDRYNISHAICNGANILSICVHPDADYAAAWATAYNDYMIEDWLPQDDRLYGSLVIAPQHAAHAAAEIRRVGNHPRFVQVLMSSATRDPMGDRRYWPIYAACAEMNLPLAVHPGKEDSGVSNSFPNGHPASYLEWHTQLSTNYMCQLTSIIARGVFQQFPNFRFVCLEGGIGWIPHLMWRFDKNWKACRSTTPWLNQAPSEVIRKHVRFSSQPIEEPDQAEHLRQIFEMMHADELLMYSSDYPHWDFDDPFKAFPKLDENLHRKIFHDNAAAFYGFDQA